MPDTVDVSTDTKVRRWQNPSPVQHQVAWVAAGLRTADREAGVGLPVDYARQDTDDGLNGATQLDVAPIGADVVIHIAPEGPDQLPVLGNADRGAQWLRDGRRYHPAATHVAAKPPVQVIGL
jgi:hypothetical protein